VNSSIKDFHQIAHFVASDGQRAKLLNTWPKFNKYLDYSFNFIAETQATNCAPFITLYFQNF